jgi:hypothetical protein
MTPDRCIVDHSQPCHACSAPGPDECPYRYILGWDAEEWTGHQLRRLCAGPPGETERNAHAGAEERPGVDPGCDRHE